MTKTILAALLAVSFATPAVAATTHKHKHKPVATKSVKAKHKTVKKHHKSKAAVAHEKMDREMEMDGNVRVMPEIRETREIIIEPMPEPMPAPEPVVIEQPVVQPKNQIVNDVRITPYSGYTRTKYAGEIAKQYETGVEVQDTLKLDQHRVYLGGQVGKTNRKDVGDVNNVRNLRYGVEGGYGYEVPVNSQLSITPKAGLGYETNRTKGDDISRIQTSRGYAEVGVDTKYKLNDKTSLIGEASYQRDLNNKQKVGNEYQKDPQWGHKYEVSAGVETEIGKTAVSIAPYYSKYENTHKSDTKSETQQTGVKLGVQF